MTERVDQVLYIPGLNDQSNFNKKEAKVVQGNLEKHGVQVTVFKPHWYTEEPFQQKIQRLVREIDSRIVT